jgi:hypothetical protein
MTSRRTNQQAQGKALAVRVWLDLLLASARSVLKSFKKMKREPVWILYGASARVERYERRTLRTAPVRVLIPWSSFFQENSLCWATCAAGDRTCLTSMLAEPPPPYYAETFMRNRRKPVGG